MNKFFALLVAILPLWFYLPLIQPYIPKKQILLGLTAGILAGLGVLFFKFSFLAGTIKPPTQETLSLTLFISFIEAGFLEEIFKNTAYWLAETHLKKEKALEQINNFSYFALGALTGLGFGILENIYYALSPEFGQPSIILPRAYTAVLAHIIMNSSFGFLRSKKINFFLALLVSVLIHAIYDFFALPSTLLGGILVRIFLIIGLGFCFWMAKESFKPKPPKTLENY